MNAIDRVLDRAEAIRYADCDEDTFDALGAFMGIVANMSEKEVARKEGQMLKEMEDSGDRMLGFRLVEVLAGCE